MADEYRSDEDAVTKQVSASNSHSAVAVSSIENKQYTSKSKEDGTNTVPYYKLFSYADSMDYLLMSVGTIGAVGNGLCTPLMTILFGRVINSLGEATDHTKVGHEILKVVINYLYLAVGAAVTSFLQMSCWMITAERQASRIRNLYLKTMLRQEVGFFDMETNTGEIIGRMSGDTVLIQEAMGEKVGSYIQLVATFSGGFAIAFTKGWLLTLILLSAIPPLVLAAATINIAVVKLASRGQVAYSGGANVVEQTIGSIRTVASFSGEKQAITKYKKSLTKAYKAGVREGLVSGFGSGSHMFITLCSFALALWYGAKMIIEQGYKGGEIMNVIFAVLIGAFSLGQASPHMSAFSAGKVAAYKVFETINRKPEIDAYDTSGVILEDIRGDIELRDVHFSYPARPDEKIFHGFSLSIPSGATAALVGQSGSGKSTVISLIERFYDPQAGQVLIDGINLKKFQLKWIRQKIGLVSQEPVLFTGSIRENIAYGKDGATTEEIRDAAELANAAKFIDKLPQGLDTMVGEHGSQLSGGQKQRVAIARAIIKNPRILLLDEATSALDAESERIVQEALNKIMINRTTVIVAHRLSTVRNAHTIVVIQNGNIAEQGPHCELIQDPDGAYNQLTRFQNIICESKQTPKESPLTNYSSPHSYSEPTAISTLEQDISASTSSDLKTPGSVSLRRLAYLHKPEIPQLLLGTLAAAVCGVLLPIFGSFVSNMIKIFFEPPHELRKDSKFWSEIFILLGVTFLLAHPLRAYLFSVAGCRLIRRVRSMCFEKVVHMEISWFDEDTNSSAAIGTRLSTDAANVRGLVGDALSLIVQGAATVLAGLIIALSANWQLSLIVLVLLPLLGVNEYFQFKFSKGFSADAKKMYANASQVVHDAVGSIRTVASFCAEEKVINLYQKKCEAPIKAGIKQGLISGIGFGVSFFSIFFVHACTYFAGGQLVAAGKAKFSDVFRVFFAIIMMAAGVSTSAILAPDVRKGRGATALMFQILDNKSKIDSSDDTGTTIQDVKGEIELHHVSFKYPTRSNVPVLRNLCLTVPSGKTVALVGESGSGKSTVIALLQRFYDPDRGYITLDGIEIQKIQVKWLRQQMGLVSQEPVLFNDTIRANIAYGKNGIATEAEILDAAKLANAHQFISSLQQGYDTIAGERGIQLSGGQKQRVAIARAILKAPKILLLDEATSALDAESEQVVQDALDRVMVDRTTVVVAHRLSTIKGADLIAVVKDGVIAEQGNHETLINIINGIYTSLVSPLQAGESSSLSQ